MCFSIVGLPEYVTFPAPVMATFKVLGDRDFRVSRARCGDFSGLGLEAACL